MHCNCDPCSPQLEKSLHSNEDLAQTKIKVNKILKNKSKGKKKKNGKSMAKVNSLDSKYRDKLEKGKTGCMVKIIITENYVG